MTIDNVSFFSGLGKDGIVGEKVRFGGNLFDIGNLDFCKVKDCVSSSGSRFCLLSACSSDDNTWGSDFERVCFVSGGKLAFSSKSVSKLIALPEPESTSFKSALPDTEELVLVVEGGLGGRTRVSLPSWLGERAGEFALWFELDEAVTAANESPLSTPRDQGLDLVDLLDDSMSDFSEALLSLETASLVE